MPGIRAVLVAGFFSGSTIGLLLLTLEGHLAESLRLNPLTLFGAFLAVGIAGMMAGSVFGLLVKLMQEKKGTVEIGGPVIVSATISGLVGFVIAYGLINALW